MQTRTQKRIHDFIITEEGLSNETENEENDENTGKFNRNIHYMNCEKYDTNKR